MSAAPMSCRAGTTLVATICTDGCSLGIKRLRTQSTGTGRSSVACSCGAFAQWKGFHGNAALRAPATATAGRFRHGSERVGHFRTPLHWETLEHPVFPYQLVKSSSIMAPTREQQQSRIPSCQRVTLPHSTLQSSVRCPVSSVLVCPVQLPAT